MQGDRVADTNCWSECYRPDNEPETEAAYGNQATNHVSDLSLTGHHVCGTCTHNSRHTHKDLTRDLTVNKLATHEWDNDTGKPQYSKDGANRGTRRLENAIRATQRSTQNRGPGTPRSILEEHHGSEKHTRSQIFRHSEGLPRQIRNSLTEDVKFGGDSASTRLPLNTKLTQTLPDIGGCIHWRRPKGRWCQYLAAEKAAVPNGLEDIHIVL